MPRTGIPLKKITIENLYQEIENLKKDFKYHTHQQGNSQLIDNITLTTKGFIKGGQTAYNTGIGFFLGYDTNKYKFSIGNPDGSHIAYNGVNVAIKAGAGSSIDFTYIDGATKPEDNADVTANHTAYDTNNVDGKPSSGFSTVVDDGVAPAAPTGLTATAGIQGIFLKWAYNTETDMSHYEIWRNTSDDSSTATKIGQIKTNLYWDSGLTAGTTYYYWIKAVDHLGNTSGFNATAGTSAVPRNVETADVTNAAITTTKIADLAVTNAKINDLDAVKITTGTLDAARIATNSITSDKISVANLSAISADLGTITTGTITGATVQTSTSGKRIVIASDKIEIYDANNNIVGTIEGAGQSGIFDLIGLNYVTAGDFTAINSSLDALVGIDSTSDLNLSTRKSGGGGGTIKLIAESGEDIVIYNNIIPNGAYSLSLGTSSYPFAYMHSGVYYFKKDGTDEKYMQINSSSGLEVNADFYVGGELSKASGSFKINHPLKPKTHWLKHSFVECPDMLNLYVGRGKIVNGKCKVKMPDWFIPLNGKNEKEYTYQLTSLNKKNNLWVEQKMNKKGEVIFAGSKDGEFSYIITAVRHDEYANKHRIKVESKK